MLLTFSSLGLDLLEMRCPLCKQVQQIASRSLSRDPRLTSCCHCKTLLVHRLIVKEKPNYVLLALEFVPVLDAAPDPPVSDLNDEQGITRLN